MRTIRRFGISWEGEYPPTPFSTFNVSDGSGAVVETWLVDSVRSNKDKTRHWFDATITIHKEIEREND